jgi:hypothetical protein
LFRGFQQRAVAIRSERETGGRGASADPLGTELRCSMDGAFMWARTCFTPEELEEELARIREDFLSRGWSLQPRLQP